MLHKSYSRPGYAASLLRLVCWETGKEAKSLASPRDTQRVSEEGEKALKNWQRRQKCVFLRENE